MTPTMAHRGPDDEGHLSDGAIALGMRRLSIIDLDGGHQPVFNEDRSVCAVINGEIYNFQELRQQLVDRGHNFRSRSDSEVVAHAYEEWGPDCVDYLRGMFALAVYDRRPSSETNSDSKGVLLLARDRLGIKPLYYYHDEQRLLFASEVRTLLESGVIPRELSRTALESYLTFGSVSEPMTLINGILSLPPGHRLTITLDGRSPSLKPASYWNLPASESRNGDYPHEDVEPARRVRQLLEESVRQHLIADVPVGVFLSGGVDSTSLAALASRAVAGIHTFTVAFPESEFSESAIARRTADKLGTSHKELLLGAADLVARLDAAVAALDQPSIDGINTYFVSWGAREAGLKVALSGLGGDEVFGGYDTFRRTPQFQKISALGNSVPKGLRLAMSAALSGAGDKTMRGDATRKLAALWDAPESLPHPYFFSRALFTPSQVKELMTENQAGADKLWWSWLAENVEQTASRDAFTSISWMETRSYLVSTLLRDADSMSMAHSLEVRVPFLDHLLVEFVAKLPEKAKVQNGTTKALLISALKDLLPLEVVQQAKRGFLFPWATWLRGPLKGSVEQGLKELAPELKSVLNRDKVEEVWTDYLNGHTSWARPWSLYVLNDWAKRHLS
jgi:asparagine synthase (glutamine-hydrolysing)